MNCENIRTQRMNAKSLFHNASIDGKVELKEKVTPRKKTLELEKSQHKKRNSVDENKGGRGKILSNMTFHISSPHQEYQDREQDALLVDKKIPILSNLSQNKWSHLPSVNVEIPRTHKQLTKYQPHRVISSVQSKRSEKKVKLKVKNRGIFQIL